MLKLNYDKLTIYEVEELYKIMLDSYNKNDEFALDFSSVQKIDMTAIQLLLSTQKSCKADEIEFSLYHVCDGLKESLKISGCSRVLEAVHE